MIVPERDSIAALYGEDILAYGTGSNGKAINNMSEKTEPRYPRVKLIDAIPLPVPFTIYIDSSSACNFKCCFCPCNQSDSSSMVRHQVMSSEVFQRILEGLQYWKENGNPVKVIYMHGVGEPCLNPRIVDMIYAIKSNQLCREVRLVTNGSLLTPALSQQLIDAGVDIIRISIEALTTEGYKELCDVNIDFNTIVQNVRDAYNYSRGTDSKISVKIFSSSLKDSKDIETYYRIFAPISDYHYIKTIRNIWPGFQSSCFSSGEYPERKICTQPFTTMLIHPNGSVSTCCVDWSFQTTYGTIEKDTLDKIWNSNQLRHLQLMHLNHSVYQKTVCSTCLEDSANDELDSCAKKIAERLSTKW